MLRGVAKRKRLRVLGALAFILGPIQFFLAMAVEGAIKPDFSQIGNAISDLGVGPYAMIFNLSVIAVGALTLVGLGAVFAAFPRKRMFWPATFMLIIAGVGAICVGLFPENTGDPHLIAAFMAFAGSGLAMVLYFPSFRGDGEWMPFALPTLMGGFVAIGALTAFTVLPNGVPRWILERVIVAPVLAWGPAVGLRIYRGRMPVA